MAKNNLPTGEIITFQIYYNKNISVPLIFSNNEMTEIIAAEERSPKKGRIHGCLYVPSDVTQNIMQEAKNIYTEFEDHKHNTVKYLTEKIEQINKRIKKSYIDRLDGNLPVGMSDEEWSTLNREWHVSVTTILMPSKRVKTVQ